MVCRCNSILLIMSDLHGGHKKKDMKVDFDAFAFAFSLETLASKLQPV